MIFAVNHIRLLLLGTSTLLQESKLKTWVVKYYGYNLEKQEGINIRTDLQHIVLSHKIYYVMTNDLPFIGCECSFGELFTQKKLFK